MRALWTSVVACLVVLSWGGNPRAQAEPAAPVAPQGVVVLVAFPPPLQQAVREELELRLAGKAEVLPLTAARREQPGTSILVGLDVWQSYQLASLGLLQTLPIDDPAIVSEPLRRWSLLWSLRYVAVYRTEVFGGYPLETWEDLALSHEAMDRLGLLPPERDAAPWLAGMEESIAAGGGEKGGYALWTTLDARAGRYSLSYDGIAEDLIAGSLAVAVVPRPLAEAWQLEWREPRVSLTDLREGTPVARLGLAVTGAISEPMRDVLALLHSSALRQAVAQRAGASVLESDGRPTATLDGQRVTQWFAHFERSIRGQGRGFEDVADMIDLVSTLVFVLIVLAVVYYQGRNKKRQVG